MQNDIIANDKYTNEMNEVLIKIIDVDQKKFKVVYKEASGYNEIIAKKRSLIHFENRE